MVTHMHLQYEHKGFESESGDCHFRFLPTGDIAEFSCGDTRINCFEGTPAEGSAANIWLRQYRRDEIAAVYPLWGAAGGGMLLLGEDGILAFDGEAGRVCYQLTFIPLPGLNAWVWRLALDPAPGLVCDVVYGQDIGVADRWNVLDNELYVAQYLGHHVFDTEGGFVVGSRQNRPQTAGNRPLLLQGMLKGRAVGYSTDAMQFFGLGYKGGAVPKGLWQNLENRNYQFELAYTALQTEKFLLDDPATLTFYGLFVQDYPKVPAAPLDTAAIASALEVIETRGLGRLTGPVPVPRRKGIFGGLFTSAEMGQAEIERLWPERQLEERGPEGRLWSFFTPEHTHVAFQAKELVCERPHGHIIMTAPDEKEIPEGVMASTNTIYGVFNAQTVIGNTSMNKLTSVHRGLLNQLRNHGQRLWVEIEGRYRLLGLPAAYEMGLNWARWHYLLPCGEKLEVMAYAAARQPCITLKVKCGKPRDMILTTQLVMGNHEFSEGIEVRGGDKTLRLTQPANLRTESPYPGLHYDLCFDRPPDAAGDDGVFFEDGAGYNHTLLTHQFRDSTGFSLVIKGGLEETDKPTPAAAPDFELECAAWKKVLAGFTLGLHIRAEEEPLAHKARQLEHTAWWFAYDALVHFASPHGLEQSSGAAWGTRDVCQGPFELFMATGRFTLARNILLTVFSNQRGDTGEWPQWFMFDKYTMTHPECHGDIVFWPLKCLAEYILATGDNGILKEAVPWQDNPEKAPVSAHLERAMSVIEARFLPGTRLISYAGGDWDDTLQPASPELRRVLVSSWTQALAAETMGVLADALYYPMHTLASKAKDHAKDITADFNSKLIVDGVVAGLVRMEPDGSITPMLHPRDTETGIRYRLISLSRSIIAGIVSWRQAAENLKLAQEHLRFPDGLHLMDRPVRYEGGNSVLFQRAEQDANVGREAGLMYTHAHIRYIEALVKAGLDEQAFEDLLVVCPPAIREMVPNASPRQANVYSSSSDAMFLDRYAFQDGYASLKDGRMPLLCGWRLYSSGPGLWFNALLRHILGIRVSAKGIAPQPALPDEAAGLTVSLEYRGRRYRFLYGSGRQVKEL